MARLRCVLALAMASVSSTNASLLPRADPACPASFQTPTGLDFDTYCESNISGWDLHPFGQDTGTFTTTENSFEDCMNRCATVRPLCYGVVFNYSNGNCWFKNETFVYVQSLVTTGASHMGVARRSELHGVATSCPYNNTSTQTVNGADFTIHCYQTIAGGDYCPYDALNCKYHANSLEHCMDSCTRARGLCTAVAWNPDMLKSYGNCYPKNNWQTFITRNNESDVERVLHSAVLQIPTIDYTCEPNAVVASSNGNNYKLTCDVDRLGQDLTWYHDTNLTSCIDTCEQYTLGKCVGVVWDTLMVSGFENCYLKSGLGAPVSKPPGYVFAQKSDTPTGSGVAGGTTTGSGVASGTPASSGGAGGVSVGVIAGAAVGGVLGLAVIAAALFYFCKGRKDRTEAASASVIGAEDKHDPRHGVVAFDPNSTPGGAYTPYSQDAKYAHEMDNMPAPQEMGGRTAPQEMVAGQTGAHELSGLLGR